MGALRLNPLLAAYPVGAIYMSTVATSPATLFGGTWERITGRFLLAATDGGASNTNGNASQAAGSQAGEAAHTLSEAEMPSHAHGLNNHTHGPGTLNITSSGAHTHPVKVRKDNTTGKSAERLGNSSSTDTISPIASSGAHTHPAANFGGATGGNSGNTTSKGSGSSHNNMPPFLAVYVWKRTA